MAQGKFFDKMKRFFIKNYVVHTSVYYTDSTGEKKLSVIRNEVQAYNKQQAGSKAQHDIVGKLQFKSDVALGK
jgi:hypothetical protein